MAVDIFLKLDGIKGESQDAKHKDEIHIQRYDMSGSQQGAHGTGGGGGAGKANIDDIKITKIVDKASPALWYHLCSGKIIPNGLITVRKAGDQPLEYLKIKLGDIIVSSLNTGGSGAGDLIPENLGLNFAKFWVEYQVQKPDGSGEPGGDMGWDIKGNVKL